MSEMGISAEQRRKIAEERERRVEELAAIVRTGWVKYMEFQGRHPGTPFTQHDAVVERWIAEELEMREREGVPGGG